MVFGSDPGTISGFSNRCLKPLSHRSTQGRQARQRLLAFFHGSEDATNDMAVLIEEGVGDASLLRSLDELHRRIVLARGREEGVLAVQQVRSRRRGERIEADRF
jgi:hypothetical protein